MFNWLVKMPLKLKIKTPEQRHSCCFGAFIVDLTCFPHGLHACFLNFTHISHIDASFFTPNK